MPHHIRVHQTVHPLLNSICFRVSAVTNSGSAFERQLNLRRIILRVAVEDHSRAFDINFARREGEVEFPLVRVLQNIRVAAAELSYAPVGRGSGRDRRARCAPIVATCEQVAIDRLPLVW